MSLIGRKSHGPTVVIKLDLSKAYDRVSWLFLLKTLRKFGFSEVFIDKIWRLLSNNWFSAIINGQVAGYFKSSVGLKQGDPFSPSLFVLIAEVLNQGIHNLMSLGKVFSFSHPRVTPLISILSFADDSIIFCNGAPSSLKNLMKFLKSLRKDQAK